VKTKQSRDFYDSLCLHELLAKYTALEVKLDPAGGLILTGELSFDAGAPGYNKIQGAFNITIRVPETFPRAIPTVKELDGKIPKDFHTNSDGTLCLGSRFRLRVLVSRNSRILNFVEKCVVPFLYGYLHQVQYGVLPFGELEHGPLGILDDFGVILGTKEPEAAFRTVELLGMKKRIANKRPCPCGSGERLGKCHHRSLNQLRAKLGRRWFLDERQQILEDIRKLKSA